MQESVTIATTECHTQCYRVSRTMLPSVTHNVTECHSPCYRVSRTMLLSVTHNVTECHSPCYRVSRTMLPSVTHNVTHRDVGEYDTKGEVEDPWLSLKNVGRRETDPDCIEHSHETEWEAGSHGFKKGEAARGRRNRGGGVGLSGGILRAISLYVYGMGGGGVCVGVGVCTCGGIQTVQLMLLTRRIPHSG